MHLYHGSFYRFTEIDLSKSKPYKDFGKGFYLAEDKTDAIAMAIKHSSMGFVYTYGFDNSALNKLKTISFDGFNNDWLNFILKCREPYDYKNVINPHDYDIVIGATAGGDTRKIVKNSGKCGDTPTADDLLDQLSQTNFGIQYLFATEEAINFLDYIDTEIYERESRDNGW